MGKLFSVILSLQLMISPLAGASDINPAGQSAGLSDAYLKTGTGSSGGYDFYVSQVMSLGTSAIGSSIITQCLEGLKTPSIATFMAGSLTHIMSEILGAKSKTDRSRKKMKDLKIKIEELKKSGDTAQLEALKAALQEEKDTRSFLENRKKWMIAVTVIYTAAMGLAIAEEVYGLASGASTSTAACSGYTASCTVGAAACAAHCAAGVGAIIAQAKAMATLPQAREMLTSYCAAYSPSPGCMTWAQVYLNLVYGSCLMLPTDGGVSLLSWSTLLTVAYGFGTSKLGQNGGQVMQYGTLLVTLLPLISQSFSKLVVAMYNFPIPRSITFGAAAVFSGTVTTGLAKRSNIAQENIDKLQNAVDKFKVETAGNGYGVAPNLPGADENPVDPIINTRPTNGQIQNLANVPKRNECFSQGANGVQLSAAGCANPIKFGTFNPGNFPLPAINQVSSLARTMGEALARGDDAGAAAMAGEIGQYASRVKAETDKLRTQYNQIQKKEKRPETDFDKSVKDQVASLQAELEKTAASNKIDLASAGAALNDEKSPVKDENTTEVRSANAPSGPAFPAGPVDPFAGMNSNTSTPNVDSEKGSDTSSQQSLSDFESSEEDISKKSDVSIFRQLSNRYILNYTKVFDRKKESEAIEEPK